MSDMSKFKVGANAYDIKDKKARGVPLTLAQYQALSYEEQHNGTAYYITDMDAVYPVDHELNANSRNAVANDIVTPHILAMENVLGAKNLFDANLAITKTDNGISYTLNADKTITVEVLDNTQSYSTYSLSNKIIDLGINLEFTCVPNGINVGYESDNRVKALVNFNSGYSIDNGDGVSVPSNKSVVGVTIYIGGDKFNVGDTFTLKPMIRPAGTDPTYVPYAMTNSELTEKVTDIIPAVNVLRGAFYQKTDNSNYEVSIEPYSVYMLVFTQYLDPATINPSIYIVFTDYSDVGFYPLVEPYQEFKITGVSRNGGVLSITWAGGTTSRLWLCTLRQ